MTKKDLKQVTENGLEVLHEMGYKITPKKRFTHEKWYDERKIKENGKLFAIVDVYNQADTICNRLNELFVENEQLKQENQKYKSVLQDMGLLMSDEEVVDIRNEISDKLLKPLFKENGFDVDINTDDGFKIIPKGDVDD